MSQPVPADDRATGARRVGRPRSARVDAAILEAALDELVERGLANVTIEGVAARAGVARSTVYRRWTSTSLLCMEALEHARTRTPEPPGRTVRDDLIFLLGHVNRVLTETRFGRVIPQLAAEARRHPDAARAYWTTYIATGRNMLAQVLRRGVEQHLITPDADHELIIELLVGPILYRNIWGVHRVTDAQVADLVDIVLAGLAPGSRPPPDSRPPRVVRPSTVDRGAAG